MVRDDRHPSPHRKQFRGGFEEGCKALHLAVHSDSKRLKGAGCRMDSAAAARSEDTLDNRSKFRRSLDRPAAARINDRPRNAARGTLLAQMMEDVGEIGLGFFVHQVVCAQLL